MDEDINKVEPDAAAMAIPVFCIRDGSIMEEGVKFGYPAWICPMCTYWKLRTVAAAQQSPNEPA